MFSVIGEFSRGVSFLACRRVHPWELLIPKWIVLLVELVLESDPMGFLCKLRMFYDINRI